MEDRCRITWRAFSLHCFLPSGIALESAGAGQAVDFCEKGWLFGFTLSQAYSAAIYLSDTAGDLADAVGTVTVLCGRVVAMTDKARTKVLAVDFPI